MIKEKRKQPFWTTNNNDMQNVFHLILHLTFTSYYLMETPANKFWKWLLFCKERKKTVMETLLETLQMAHTNCKV